MTLLFLRRSPPRRSLRCCSYSLNPPACSGRARPLTDAGIPPPNGVAPHSIAASLQHRFGLPV
jgi:hypothetical protein